MTSYLLLLEDLTQEERIAEEQFLFNLELDDPQSHLFTFSVDDEDNPDDVPEQDEANLSSSDQNQN